MQLQFGFGRFVTSDSQDEKLVNLEAITPPTKEMKAMRLFDCKLKSCVSMRVSRGFTLLYQGWGISHGEREHPQATRFACHDGI